MSCARYHGKNIGQKSDTRGVTCYNIKNPVYILLEKPTIK